MAETVLAGKEIEKLAAKKTMRYSRVPLTKLARLAKNFLMRNRPGDTGDRDRQDEQPDKLETD